MCVNRLINSHPTHKFYKRAAIGGCCSTLEDVTQDKECAFRTYKEFRKKVGEAKKNE